MTVSPTTEYPRYDSGNSTEYSESPFGNLWTTIPSLLIALAGLLGNGAVLWLLGFRIRRTPFSVYILNLAGADTLFLCSSLLRFIPLLLGYFFRLTWRILAYFTFMFYTTGMSLLAAISTERCLAALFPLWYRCRRPKHTSATVCAVLWALAGMFWLVTVVFLEYAHPFFHLVFITSEGVYFLLLTCVLCMSSLTLLLRVQCGSRRRRPPRLYLLVLLTVLVFLLCGLPWGIGDFVYIHFNRLWMAYWLSDLLACVNSSVNPLIYFFVGRSRYKRREPFRVVLQRALGDEQESEGEITNAPHTVSQETTI